MQLESSQKGKYFDFDLSSHTNLPYPLYKVYPGEKEPQAAFLVIDMAWINSFFLAGWCDDSHTLQDTDWNNRIMQFGISPLVTTQDLQNLANDAYFYFLVHRIYSGCTPTTGFKTCNYNEDARLAFDAITEHLKKIPTITVTNHQKFYQALKKKHRPLAISDTTEVMPGIFMQICPQNSEYLKSIELTFPHEAGSQWPAF